MLLGAVAERERAVDRRFLGRDFLQADVGDAAEQRRRQRRALRVDDLRVARGQFVADRADAAAAHQHVGVLQRAARGGGVHGGVADQQVLRGRVGAASSSAATMQRP